MSEHVDEGTIHAWLDGQLKPDASARIESHIAGCATCAELVAEARGFIAASSRIVSALDGVPAKVLPARRRGPNIWQLRVAAAVVVMALGSAVFLRERISMNMRAQYGARATDAPVPRAASAPPGTANVMPSVIDSVAETSAMRAEAKTNAPTVLDRPTAPPVAAIGGERSQLKHSERRAAAAPEPTSANSAPARNDVAAADAAPAAPAPTAGLQASRREAAKPAAAPATPSPSGVVTGPSSVSAANAAKAPPPAPSTSNAARDQLNLAVQKSALAERASDSASVAPAAAPAPAQSPSAGAPVPSGPPKPTVIELTTQAVGVPSVCTGSVIAVATSGGDSVTVRLGGGGTPGQVGGAAGQAQRSLSGGVARYTGSWAPLGEDSAIVTVTQAEGGRPMSSRVLCFVR